MKARLIVLVKVREAIPSAVVFGGVGIFQQRKNARQCCWSKL